MSQAVGQAQGDARGLAQLYAPVQEQMAEVETIFRRELASRIPSVDELVQYGFRLGGKRLRPALLLLTASACGRVRRPHLVLAAVVEMIHTATLLHDDVLDGATTRRHLKTVNSSFGNKTSVLLGDYLYTHAFTLASTLDSTLACQLIGRTTNLVCEGELRQVHNSGNLELSEEEYVEMIAAKTGELCACCCRLGAQFSDDVSAETIEAAERFGRDLGIAFQITDDVLDVLGDESVTGKSLGTDLAQQKLTLPIIHFLRQFPPEAREAKIESMLLGHSNGQPLRELLESSGSLAYTFEAADRYVQSAHDNLAILPPGPARAVLAEMTQFVVDRRH